MKNANGTATYRVHGHTSHAVTKVVPARITPKRITSMTHTWDKTGKRLSRSLYGAHLLGYQITGESYVELST